MSSPNLLNSTVVLGKIEALQLNTTKIDVVSNNAGSNTVIKLNNITITNYGTAAVTSNVFVNRNATDFAFVSGLLIPPNSTLTVMGKDNSLYLEEGDKLSASMSSNNSGNIFTSYELIS